MYKPIRTAVAARPGSPAPHYKLYNGVELKRNPGIPDARFQAYELPSRIGNGRVYPRNVESKDES